MLTECVCSPLPASYVCLWDDDDASKSRSSFLLVTLGDPISPWTERMPASPGASTKAMTTYNEASRHGIDCYASMPAPTPWTLLFCTSPPSSPRIRELFVVIACPYLLCFPRVCLLRGRFYPGRKRGSSASPLLPRNTTGTAYPVSAQILQDWLD